MTVGRVAHDAVPVEPAERRLPPVAELAAGTLVLIVIGGIYLAAHFPGRTPLAPAVGLLVAAAAVMAAALAALSRVGAFAWHTFVVVFGWTLLAYLVIAGMLEYIFVVDGTRGAALLVVSLMLAVYAVDIPLILAFSVARYQPPAGAVSADPALHGGPEPAR